MNEAKGGDCIVRVLAKEAGVLAMACSARSVVEEAARRQPLLFLGGAFVAGVATARFLKAAGQGNGRQSGPKSQSYGYRATGPGSRVGGSRGGR